MTSATIHQLAVRTMRDIIVVCNRRQIRVDNVEAPISPKEITGFRVARVFSLQLLEMTQDHWYLFDLLLDGAPHVVWEYGSSSLENYYCYACMKAHKPTKACSMFYPKVVKLDEIRNAKEEIFLYLLAQLKLPKR